ncbi:methyltransferase GidB [Oscillochloris trichoides DG-6]|uniref:Ribosomal RNA small subunit methyltransferase G n=1 Tax=Oscillochloris trichoides DG-6 TaxID=765420 RepID=E1IGN5_9CHLR|nr:16S rRNA (guanine(527)-N(7))-methyltransferase RsmG [Oscillochloris trichoides]EFO79622.1 methyltransferase GidB [Oscillochloris trichoides DG-6]
MSDAPHNLLVQTCSDWGLNLNPTQLDQLAHYAQLLREWNERINLTTITDLGEIYRRHFLDSLSLARFWGTGPQSLVDIGSGAGFPGLVLKILRPELRLTLVESVGKKAEFMRHVARELNLYAVRVLDVRAEDVGRNAAERAKHDLVTARAVAELRVLVEYALPLLQMHGRLLAAKGPAVYSEVAAAEHALRVLGGKVVGIEPVELPGQDAHVVVLVEKINPTDPRYPRAAGVPTRKPL